MTHHMHAKDSQARLRMRELELCNGNQAVYCWLPWTFRLALKSVTRFICWSCWAAGVLGTLWHPYQADEHEGAKFSAIQRDTIPSQVGGDGLFQEVLDGWAALCCSGDGPRAAAAAQLRLGQIPGGSTDAVAYSLHGTRSAAAAALHAALGDR